MRSAESPQMESTVLEVNEMPDRWRERNVRREQRIFQKRAKTKRFPNKIKSVIILKF